MKEKVIVALSGGVDSAVSAALLLESGKYEVEGVFMKNWSPETTQSLTDCPWEEDQKDAEAVCQTLGIPFRSINFEAEYKSKVVDYLIREYDSGRTPNPDIMCNQEIKFRVFLEEAMRLGGTKIATGHYARLRDGKLLRGVDPSKDQSYFLYTLNQSQLEHVIFPIGDILKSEVRALADKYRLPVSQKKDSQGICFIGHLDLKSFLKNYLSPNPGKLFLLPADDCVSLEERIRHAEPVGEHPGANYYTIGEKLNRYLDHKSYHKIRGASDIPLVYLIAKGQTNNELYISDKHEDKALYKQLLELEKPIETGGRTDQLEVSTVEKWREICSEGKLTCQIRYRQNPCPVEAVKLNSKGNLELELMTPGVWGPAVGQAVVLFNHETVLGGGVLCATR